MIERIKRFKCASKKNERPDQCNQKTARKECFPCGKLIVITLKKVVHARNYIYECPKCKRIKAPVDSDGSEIHGAICTKCGAKVLMELTESTKKIPFEFWVKDGY